jgi:hypothetical protein
MSVEVWAMLTLFTAPKPFRGHIGVIQTNAIRSWIALAPDVEVLLVGDEPGVQEAAEAHSIRCISSVRRAESGAPSLRSAFDAVQRVARHSILGYLNADILLLDDFLPAVTSVVRQLKRFLIVGQRWDLEVKDLLHTDGAWQADLRRRLAAAGRLHRPVGSDYFVFPGGQYDDLPDFTIGRSGWDNWMIYDGRRRRIPVIDASRSIMVIHQNHDYAHLPGGVTHHRHPESRHNLELAGGRETIFRLEDADWRLADQGPIRKGPFEFRYPRRWEADLIARAGPGRRARRIRMAFRPLDTLRALLGLPPRKKRRPRAAAESESASSPAGGGK